MKRKLALAALPLIAVLALVAQSPKPPASSKPKYGVMTFSAPLGSFVFEGEGTARFSFTGTLMVSKLQGTAKVSGAVREEYNGLGRRIWFGTGNAVIQGKWRKVQWFGKNLSGSWNGSGTALLYGEYDTKTKGTGTVQVDGQPPAKWGVYGRQEYVPKELNPAWDYMQKQRAAGRGG